MRNHRVIIRNVLKARTFERQEARIDPIIIDLSPH